MINYKGTIVYIGGMEMPDGNAAAHRIINNSKVFKELGYHIVFCGMDKLINVDAKEPIIFGEFESYPMKYPSNGKEWCKQLFDFSHIKYVLDKYDDIKFIVAYNMHAKPLINVLNYSHKKNIKVIADITEWYDNKLSINPIKFIKWFDTRMVMKYLHKKVDGIISISTFLTNYYTSYVKHIVQVPPLVDLSEKLWDKPSYKKTDMVEFVYSGVPGRDKDKINLIIDCFYNLRNLAFVFRIVGLTKEQFLKDYPNYAEKIQILSSKIEFIGRVSHKESIDYLYQSDYCIFVRERTRKNMAGFPTKFVECCSTGIGIIVNDFSNISDYFPLENAYMINYDDFISVISSCISKGKIEHKMQSIFNYSDYGKIFEKFLFDVECQ